MSRISMSKSIFWTTIITGAIRDGFTNDSKTDVWLMVFIGLFAALVANIIFERSK